MFRARLITIAQRFARYCTQQVSCDACTHRLTTYTWRISAFSCVFPKLRCTGSTSQEWHIQLKPLKTMFPAAGTPIRKLINYYTTAPKTLLQPNRLKRHCSWKHGGWWDGFLLLTVAASPHPLRHHSLPALPSHLPYREKKEKAQTLSITGTFLK